MAKKKNTTSTKKLTTKASPFFDMKIILGVLVLLLLALSLVVMVVFPGGLDNRGEAASYRWWRNNMGPGSKLCSTEYSPVCGKDGKTYNNLCEAYRAGVSISKQGKCDGSRVISPAPVEMGDKNKDSGSSDTTANKNSDGSSNPLFCTEVLDPVCGVDGKTYNNQCYAQREGVSVKCDGSCPCGSNSKPGIIQMGY